jgi:hypothetical protein
MTSPRRSRAGDRRAADDQHRGRALIFAFPRDGLIIAYVDLDRRRAGGGAVAADPGTTACPHGWSRILEPSGRWRGRTFPLAAADAIEWGSRRLDIAILGLFVAPYWVGIYYIAQNVASLPAKLKTSFDPILAPVITQKLSEGDLPAVASAGAAGRLLGHLGAGRDCAFALAIPGEAVMGLGRTGIRSRHGRARLPAVRRSRRRDRGRFGGGAGLRGPYPQPADFPSDDRDPGDPDGRLILGVERLPLRPSRSKPLQSAAAAVALMIALALASVLKSKLLGRILGAPVQGWRWSLIWAAAAAAVAGSFAIMLPEWAELILGIPAILIAFGAVLWVKGFGPEDRELFRMKKTEIDDLQLPPPGFKGGRPG